jgi:hypothetical protein
MKKSLIILIFCGILTLGACSDNKDKFINTYKDILTVRLMFPDTAVANPKVNKVLERNGYSKKTFAEEFEKFSSEPEEFHKMMDSARERARREYSKSNKVHE